MRFLVLPTVVAAIVHVYLWRRLVRDLALSRAARWSATAALLALWATIPATLFSVLFLPRTGESTLALIGFGWAGLTIYLTALLVLGDFILWLVLRRTAARMRAERLQPSAASRGTRMREGTGPSAEAGVQQDASARERPEAREDASSRQGMAASARASSEISRTAVRGAAAGAAPPKAEPASEPALDVAFASALESRRVFFARAVAGSALLATGAVGVFGVHSALGEIVTPEVPVKLPRLPRQLDGYKIALLTDVHIGPMLGRRYLRQLVDETNRLKPDLIAIGGDLVDGTVSQIGSLITELQRLHARDGVFFVTGNHEYYSGSGAWIRFLQKLGLNVLQNEHATVGDASAKGAQLDIAGMPDRMGAMWGHGPDVLQATRDRNPDHALVMLAHQPVQIAESVKVGAGLQLSGHTHGGQLMPFGEIARLRQPYIAGLHQHPGSDTQIYVSCGAGFWGPPLRVFAPAEITQIRLVSG